jgi:mRNA interferase RelE/StbE
MDVILDKQPEKYLERLSPVEVRRIALALRKLSQEPPQGDIVKQQDKDGEYRLRVGELRILYRVEESIRDDKTTEKHIVVYKIAPRGQAYKE